MSRAGCRCGHAQSSHMPFTDHPGRNPCRPLRGKGYCTCTGWDPPPDGPLCPVGITAHDNPRLGLCSCVPGQIELPI